MTERTQRNRSLNGRFRRGVHRISRVVRWRGRRRSRGSKSSSTKEKSPESALGHFGSENEIYAQEAQIANETLSEVGYHSVDDVHDHEERLDALRRFPKPTPDGGAERLKFPARTDGKKTNGFDAQTHARTKVCVSATQNTASTSESSKSPLLAGHDQKNKQGEPKLGARLPEEQKMPAVSAETPLSKKENTSAAPREDARNVGAKKQQKSAFTKNFPEVPSRLRKISESSYEGSDARPNPIDSKVTSRSADDVFSLGEKKDDDSPSQKFRSCVSAKESQKKFFQGKSFSPKSAKRSSVSVPLPLFQESIPVIRKFPPAIILGEPSMPAHDPYSAPQSKYSLLPSPNESGELGIDDLEGFLSGNQARRRTSINLASIAHFQNTFMEMVLTERAQEWLSSFRRSDPRFQIMKYFNDVAQEGADIIERQGEVNAEMTSPILRIFKKASVFTVWRPTSTEAIKKMMKLEGTGKGLDIKGKSAKKGKLSAYVPFLQIHDEEHKKMVKTLTKEGRIRIFYRTKEARDKAAGAIGSVISEMIQKVQWGKSILSDPDADPETSEEALSMLVLEMSDPSILHIDYETCCGIDVPERAFWDMYVTRKDITRKGELDTGRPSEPAFQDMNFAAIHRKIEEGEPRAVVWQQAPDDDPLCSQCLLMAYEEHGRVLPVVSDFDCFMVGTRGVRYNRELPPEQIKTVDWCLTQIEKILDGPVTSDGWTKRWLEVLKMSAKEGFYPKIPKYGFGDPRSSFIMECAIDRLKGNGAVRHGAECFNYYFPQELDDHFLIISDTLPGKVPWKYVNAAELREILSHKIDQGFTFPLNPKWVLCDKGWKKIYHKLWASERPNVQASLNCWYPPGSGLRDRIETMLKSYPRGFQVAENPGNNRISMRSAMEEMDLAEEELRRYLTLQRAKQKLRGALFLMRFMDKRREGGDDTEGGTGDTENFKRMQVAKIKLKAMYILTQMLERKRQEGRGPRRRFSRELKSIHKFVSTGNFSDSDSQEIRDLENLGVPQSQKSGA